MPNRIILGRKKNKNIVFQSSDVLQHYEASGVLQSLLCTKIQAKLDFFLSLRRKEPCVSWQFTSSNMIKLCVLREIFSQEAITSIVHMKTLLTRDVPVLIVDQKYFPTTEWKVIVQTFTWKYNYSQICIFNCFSSVIEF